MTRRTLVNLVAVAAASAVLLLYGLTQLLVGTVLDPTYRVHLRLPDTGGLVEDQEVTQRGRAIGQIADVELDGDGVRLLLAIDEEFEVPSSADVRVLRASAVGEQTLDIRPTADVPSLAPGEELVVGQVELPTQIQPLLELAAEVFEPVDSQQAGEVVASLADAVRGRRDDIRGLMDSSARLSGTVADSGEDYDRFFASSRRVNAALADNRETLAGLFDDISAATSILREMRGDYEALLATGPPLLAQLQDVVWRAQPNLSCSLAHLGGINAFMAQPEQLENAGEALRVNQYFFEGFNTITPQDNRGNYWQRIHLVMEPEPPAEQYYPDKRPIPATLPGGACDSPAFGPGAPAAHQPGHEVVVPEGRVIRPDDDRAEPVRRGPRQDADGLAGRGDATAGSQRDDAAIDGRGTDDDADEVAQGSDRRGSDELTVTGLAVLAVLVTGAAAVVSGWGTLRAALWGRKEDS